MRTGLSLMVIPFSFSSSIESKNCVVILLVAMVFVISKSRSANVDFPWSICAMIQKFLMCSWDIMCSDYLFSAQTSIDIQQKSALWGRKLYEISILALFLIYQQSFAATFHGVLPDWKA